MKDELLTLLGIKTYPLEFKGKKLFYKDFLLRESDEINALLFSALDEENKVKKDTESIKTFNEFCIKTIAYSLCDKNGKQLFTADEIGEKFSSTGIQDIFKAIDEKKKSRDE